MGQNIAIYSDYPDVVNDGRLNQILLTYFSQGHLSKLFPSSVPCPSHVVTEGNTETRSPTHTQGHKDNDPTNLFTQEGRQKAIVEIMLRSTSTINSLSCFMSPSPELYLGSCMIVSSAGAACSFGFTTITEGCS